MSNPYRRPVKEDGLDLLMRALVTGSASDGILAQEADGQRSFASSETLPTDMRGDAKATLEAAGVKFLGVVEEDPMFQYVELPTGWRKIMTDHSMWTDLCDDKGRKRASIFYKAAFYDRSAFIGVSRRYGVRIDYTRLDEEKVAVALVTDGDETLYTTEPIEAGEGRKRYDAEDEARGLAVAWLNESYPEWESEQAYWD